MPGPVAVPRCPGGCGATCRGGGAGGGGGGAEAGRWRSGDAAARSLPAAAAGRGAGGPGEEREEGKGAGQGMGEAPGVAAERCPPPVPPPPALAFPPCRPRRRGGQPAPRRTVSWKRVAAGARGGRGLRGAAPVSRGRYLPARSPGGGFRWDPGGFRDLRAPGLLSRAQPVPVLKSRQRSLAAEGMEGTELAEPPEGSRWLWEPPQQRGGGHEGSSPSLCPTVGHDPVTAAPAPPHPLQRGHLTGGLTGVPPPRGTSLEPPLVPRSREL